MLDSYNICNIVFSACLNDGFVLYTQDLLETVFENGQLLREYTLDKIREQAELKFL